MKAIMNTIGFIGLVFFFWVDWRLGVGLILYMLFVGWTSGQQLKKAMKKHGFPPTRE